MNFPDRNMKNVARIVQEKLAPAVVSDRDELQRRINEVTAHHESVTRRLKSVVAERDDLLQGKERDWNSRHMDRILHHHPWRIAGKSAVVSQGNRNDDDSGLIGRVATAYRSAVQTPVGSTESIWLNEFAGANSATHETLMHGDFDAVANLLRNPASSMLFYGFDSIQAQDAPKNEEAFWVAWNHRLTYDSLLQLARAVGARRVENPETNIDFDDAPDVEDLLAQLDAALGFKIDFPNLFPGELGLETSRGVANYRAAQSLYQAWRIANLVRGKVAPRVMEIGAGLGRTAYYATKMGIADYTIIDIPLTGVAQGYYLGNVLGETAVSLWGEEQSATIRILPPVAYETLNERFDLITNFDSLTEMARSTAEQYLQGASRLTDRFLSINHEHNAFTVESIYSAMSYVQVSRAPCWVRRGYVEEVLDLTA